MGNALAGASEISNDVIRAVWDSVGATIHAVVRECNSVAGEEIWGLADEIAAARLTVSCRLSRSSALELSLHADDAALHCTFRTPRRHECWVFHILPDGANLRRATRTYGITDAVNTILDGLVCGRASERLYSA